MDKKLDVVSVIQELESRYESKKDKNYKKKTKHNFILARPSLREVIKSEIYISIQFNESSVFADIYLKSDLQTGSRTICLMVHSMKNEDDFNKLLNMLDKFDIIVKFLEHQDLHSIKCPNISFNDSNSILVTISRDRRIKKNQSYITAILNDETIEIKNHASNMSISIKTTEFYTRQNLVNWWLSMEDSLNKKK